MKIETKYLNEVNSRLAKELHLRMMKLGEKNEINIENIETQQNDYKMLSEFEFLGPLFSAYDDKI
jgi:hypothetical protein